MKKVLTICLIMSCATISFAQTSAYPSSVTVYIYLKEKRYDRAKPVIDELCLNVPLKYDPKTNFYKGLIYQGIFDDTTECNYGISKDSALIVSLQAYINSYLFNVDCKIPAAEIFLLNSQRKYEFFEETINDTLRDTLTFINMCDSLFPEIYSYVGKAVLLNVNQKKDFIQVFNTIESRGKNIDRSKVSICYNQFILPEIFGTFTAEVKRHRFNPDSRHLYFGKNYTFHYYILSGCVFDRVKERVSGLYVLKGKRLILYPSDKSGKMRFRLKNDMLIQKFLIFNRFRFR